MTTPQTSVPTLSPSPQLPLAAAIQARVMISEVTFYAVTEDQIRSHGALGTLFTAFLSLFGVSAEGSFASWLAIEQGVVSPASKTTITVVMWVGIVAAIILGVCAAIFYVLQSRSRDSWVKNSVKFDATTGAPEAA